MRSWRRGLRVRNVSTASTHGSSLSRPSRGEREGGRFEAASPHSEVRRTSAPRDRFVIVASCAAPAGGARRHPSRSRCGRYRRIVAGVGTYTIGKLAEAAGVNVETVRYYERRGLLEQPERDGGGYRQYNAGDLWRLQFIRRGKQLRLTV